MSGTNGDALEYVISVQLMGLGFTTLYVSVLDLDLALALAKALDMLVVDVFDFVLAVAILEIHVPIYQVYYLL
jgi:hypothetical protein